MAENKSDFKQFKKDTRCF